MQENDQNQICFSSIEKNHSFILIPIHTLTKIEEFLALIIINNL